MSRTTTATLLGILLAAGASAYSLARTQEPAKSSEEREPPKLAGMTVNAVLNTSLNSKKAKIGEKVEAHTTEALTADGKTILPKGAKLEGHITEATARSKGDSGSTLAIEFDKAELKRNEEVSLEAILVALAPPRVASFPESQGPGSDPMSEHGAGAAGGSPMGATPSMGHPEGTPNFPQGTSQPRTDNSQANANGSAQLPAKSRGVYGIKDLRLMESASKVGVTTFLSSTGKEVHLEGGTRLLLMVKVASDSSTESSR
ncbi:MAG TPA: hypothetical protein VJN93_16785 [Candidatus Acidoferrum sp.]|nr:hypothetical protein [Candidatus Acidoferrum sp.]